MTILLGIVIGLLLSILIITALIYFRVPIERTMTQAKNKITRPKGVIIEDDTLIDILREEFGETKEKL